LNWKVTFYRHGLGEAELEAVREVLNGPILTTGETVRRFEERFADFLSRKHVLAVTSCTGALHMSLLAMGIGAGDEVITTPMTFVATGTAILEAGAIPVFADVERDTGNLDATKVEAAITERTKAIIPVHLYGLMCDMRALRQIADRYDLRLIEDSAHCIEGERDDIRPGELSDTVCFSFYATKNITCGEGGAVVTDSDELAERLRLLRLHGMSSMAAERYSKGYKHWDMTTLGWKYNMDNIHAALLLPQLERILENLKKRELLARRYQDSLAGIPGVLLPAARKNTVHARHLLPIWVDARRRDDVVAELTKDGIGVVVNYRPLTLLKYFSERFGYKEGDFPAAERIGRETISLPFYPDMPEAHVDYLVASLTRIMGAGA